MDRLFVDTGAFIALNDTRDQYHALATRFYEDIGEKRTPLLSTNCILNEAYSWLQRQSGFRFPAAWRFGEWFRGVSSHATLRGSPETGRFGRAHRVEVTDPRKPFTLLYTDPAIEEEAWGFFAQHGASGATYTDCISFAVMKMLGLKRAFTFDEHFEEAGFSLVPGKAGSSNRASLDSRI